MLNTYFADISSNIFKNYVDSIFGIIILTIFPLISLILLFCNTDKLTFFNYTFPLLSICGAGMYDAYGRFEEARHEESKVKNRKLRIRITADVLSSIISLIALFSKNVVFYYSSPIILLIIGLLLDIEAFFRITTAIQIKRGQ